MNRLLLFALSILLFSCSKNTPKESYQTSRDNIIKAKKNIHEIDFGQVYIGTFAIPYIFDDYLVICDMKASETPINVFERETFKHIVSFGEVGQGPKEITIIGYASWNSTKQELLVEDSSKEHLFVYNMDSVINNCLYVPEEKYIIKHETAPSEFCFINDTMSYCRTMIPTGTNSFHQSTGIWDMRNGEIKLMENAHPELHAKRYWLAISLEDSIYAECNYLYDMISIFDLNGNLTRNIFGPQWGTTHLQCHSGALFTRDYLVTIYNGDRYEDETFSRKCLIFNKNGDYVATLDIDYNIIRMCYDKINDRIIFTFDDEIQFGYLDLGEIGL